MCQPIWPFDTASYCSKRKIITDNFNQPEYKKSKIEISGTLIRELLQKGEKIPSYLMRTELTEILENMFKNSSNKVFYNVNKNKT